MEHILHFEEHPNDTLTLLLFTHVTNSGDLRQLIISGKFEPEVAIINPTLLPGLLVLQASAHKALTAQRRGALRTKTLYAELVFGLSGAKHIGEALSRFGPQDGCHHLLVARFNASPEDVDLIRAAVAGKQAPLSELPSLTDVAALRRQYKVLDEELNVGSLTQAIVSRIAARDCA